MAGVEQGADLPVQNARIGRVVNDGAHEYAHLDSRLSPAQMRKP